MNGGYNSVINYPVLFYIYLRPYFPAKVNKKNLNTWQEPYLHKFCYVPFVTGYCLSS